MLNIMNHNPLIIRLILVATLIGVVIATVVISSYNLMADTITPYPTFTPKPTITPTIFPSFTPKPTNTPTPYPTFTACEKGSQPAFDGYLDGNVSALESAAANLAPS